MSTLASFLSVSSPLGVSRGALLALVALLALEWALGRSKDPRLRSVASAVAAVASRILDMLSVAKLPVVGPAIVSALRSVSGAAAPYQPRPPVETPTPPVPPPVPPDAK